MLEEVRITGLGVIDDAVLELSAGFTALTGETGAGKTMVVTALGLLFGGRADPARVRHRAVRDELEALTRAERERVAEAETLRFGLAEIEAASPVAGEDATLLAEEEKLANADALQAAATTAHEALLGDPASASVDASDAVTLLGLAVRALEPVRSHDPALAGLADRLAEASYLI